MLQNMNKFLGKWMPFITPVSVVIGVLASTYLHSLVFLVPWVFAFMSFSGSLNSNFKSFQHTVTNPLPILLALTVLHIIMPLWARGIGLAFFSNDPHTITGLILAAVIPTGITSMIWVTMYKGNIPLTLSIILIDTLLSPIVTPLSMELLVGQSIEMPTLDIMKGLLWMVVIPSLAGMSLNQFGKPTSIQKLSRNVAPFAKLGLPICVIINSSVIAPYLNKIDLKFFQITLTMLFIAICGYLFIWVLGAINKRNKEDIVALVFTGGMRNISAGAVIAVSFFPPQVALPVVVCMLFQQILAASHGHLINLYYEKGFTLKRAKVKALQK
ncbi:bile acid:sodium symporter family protein [Bacillus sp. 03113]|uniref:bile acid:sodium symporter family protein n=1 Tax=Bacillus sp. 03113 TaxID=2578211 RepID=UPI001141F48D|nr:bile acid:sodium symporter family protein [Bacillus sp. 03113]